MEDDIERRVAADFTHADRVAALDVLTLLAGEPGGGDPRVLRCVVVLADGDVTRLTHYADAARLDPRDVIYWAEYDAADALVRDFRLPIPPV